MPSVEYKGVVPPDQLQDKKTELEKEANELISKGAKVLVSVFPYEEAAKLCGGPLPSYISEDSTPCIVKFGDYPGCPCGGTHVADIADIGNLKGLHFLRLVKQVAHSGANTNTMEEEEYEFLHVTYLMKCSEVMSGYIVELFHR